MSFGLDGHKRDADSIGDYKGPMEGIEQPILSIPKNSESCRRATMEARYLAIS